VALKLRGYFHTLFDKEDEAPVVRALSDGVQGGQGAIAVFPRGDIETQHAFEILRLAKPLQLYEHDLDKQALEHAASEDAAPVVEHVVDAVTGTKETRT
jgi:hypothetical protein